MTFGFIAKNKLSDKGEERIVCLDIEKNDNIIREVIFNEPRKNFIIR